MIDETLLVEAVAAAGPVALDTLVALCAEGQPGTVRVAAARHLLDLALKLSDSASDLGRLDQALSDLRETAAGLEEEV